MPAVNWDWDELEDNIDEEYDDSGNTIAEHTTEPGYHGQVISQHRNGQTHYYHGDGMGNVVALTVDAGNVTDTFVYSAFGDVTERTGSTVNAFQYQGQRGYYRDEIIGDYLVRTRPLSARHGRWLSIDPLAIDGRTVEPGVLDQLRSILLGNGYLVCRNNPVNGSDPSGLACECNADPDPCKGKLRTAKLCIVKWHGTKLDAKDLNLDAVNAIWKQCCIKFEIGDTYMIGKPDTEKNIGDDLKYDHPKDNSNVGIRLLKVSDRRDDCIFVNFFKEAGGFDDLVLAQSVIQELFNWKHCFVAFNQGTDWQKNIGQTAAHEFGHCLGLNHCAEKEDETEGCDDEKKPCDRDHLMHYAPSADGKSKLTEGECKEAEKSPYLGKPM